jgi:hypothetical protein
MKKPKPKETVTTTLRMPRPLWLQIQHAAIDQGKGIAELILHAVGEYLKGGKP